MVILLVLPQVLRQLVDPVGQDRDLDFRRTSVAFVGCVLGNDLCLCFFGKLF